MRMLRLLVMFVSVLTLGVAGSGDAIAGSKALPCIEYGVWGPVCYESTNCPSISIGVNECIDEAPPGAAEECNICPMDEFYCDEDCDIDWWSWWCFAVEEEEECYPI